MLRRTSPTSRLTRTLAAAAVALLLAAAPVAVAAGPGVRTDGGTGEQRTRYDPKTRTVAWSHGRGRQAIRYDAHRGRVIYTGTVRAPRACVQLYVQRLTSEGWRIAAAQGVCSDEKVSSDGGPQPPRRVSWRLGFRLDDASLRDLAERQLEFVGTVGAETLRYQP